MTQAAAAGLFVYAKDLVRVASFYTAVLNLQVRHADEDTAVLDAAGLQLLVHRIPSHIAVDIDIRSPPELRETSALKFFFTVPSLVQAAHIAAQLGGEVFTYTWNGPGFVACNAYDPEGNIFQLREAAEAPTW